MADRSTFMQFEILIPVILGALPGFLRCKELMKRQGFKRALPRHVDFAVHEN
jgi:hypothetical protein